MTDLRDAARQALKSLRGYRREISCEQPCDAERALEAALEHPEQEPVAKSTWQKLYETAIDQRNEAVAEVKRLLEQPNRAQNMRDAGYTRRPTLREMADSEQPEQEPLAWLESPYGSIRMNTTMRFQFPPQSLKWKIPLYLHPPRREWQGLTDEEMVAIAHRKCWEYRHSSDPHHSHTYKFNHSTLTDFRYAIEAALKERNV